MSYNLCYKSTFVMLGCNNPDIISCIYNFVSAEKIKRDCDQMFGFPWNVIVGESFDFDIEYDDEFCYYFFYGPIAVLAYKVGTM